MTLPQDIHQVMKQAISMEQPPSENTHSKGPDAAPKAATTDTKKTRLGRQKSNRKALKIYRMKAFLEELNRYNLQKLSSASSEKQQASALLFPHTDYKHPTLLACRIKHLEFYKSINNITTPTP